MFTWGKRWMKECLGKTRDFIDSVTNKSTNKNDSNEAPSRRSQAMRRTIQWLGTYKKQLIITTSAIVGAVWVSGCVVIAHQHYVNANTKEVFHVYIDGVKKGTVTDPRIVERFLDEKRDEIQQEYPDVHMDLAADHVTFRSERGFKLAAENAETLREIAQLVEPVATGVELWIEDRLFAVVKDQQTADDILKQIESKYVPKKREVSVLSASQTNEDPIETNLEKVEFVENVDVVEVETKPEKIMDANKVLALLEQGDTKEIKYEVQPGDCISCIAQKFDVTTDFIYEKNPWIKGEFLQIGDELDLTVEQPALSVRTVVQYEEMESIPYSTRYEDDDTMRVGMYETIQNGQDGRKRVSKELVKVNGMVTEENVVEEEIIREPVEEVIKKGTKVVTGVGTGTFRWPVISPKVTSGYGMRWGKMHKGIDMVSTNRNILAADHGKISETGFNDGYGNYIIIDHDNGYKTLYGHLSEISVSQGTTVEKGDKIGTMGSTGHSTGVHLHFEVHKDGAVQNPSDYLS